MGIFHFPNYKTDYGFIQDWHINHVVMDNYTEVSEQEFLAEFGKKVKYQVWICDEWMDTELIIRIKPTPDYTELFEALQAKAKENGMKVIIKFEEL